MRQWQVRDVMTVDVVTARSSTSPEDALELLDSRHISAMPVVDDLDRVVGVVSRTDLLSGMRSARRHARPRRRSRVAALPARVGDVMSIPALTVAADTLLAVAAKRMQSRKVKRLPVTGETGRLVGILSATDLLRVFARLDTEICDDVVQEMQRLTSWVERDPVHVVVRSGVVTLVGTLDTRSTVELAERLIFAVPGVVSVANRLEFDYDDTAAIHSGNAG